MRILVTIKRYTGENNGELFAHATRKGPAVWRSGSVHTYLEPDGTTSFAYVLACDPDAPWYQFIVTDPIPVESNFRKAC